MGAANVRPTSPSRNAWILAMAAVLGVPRVRSPSNATSPPTTTFDPWKRADGRLRRFPVVMMTPDASGSSIVFSCVAFSSHSWVTRCPAAASILAAKFMHPATREEFLKLTIALFPMEFMNSASPSSTSPRSEMDLKTRSSMFPVVITVPVASGNVMRRFAPTGVGCGTSPGESVAYAGSAPSERESGAVPIDAKSTVVVGAFIWLPWRKTKVSTEVRPCRLVTSWRFPEVMIVPEASGRNCVRTSVGSAKSSLVVW
mmetsp:Transcript_30477/g.72480  ORF Transcript_30477/g.72480 Transcript_30477/m.72480 type:complete len:257 (-) Transcript_30477:1808-2578(-)